MKIIGKFLNVINQLTIGYLLIFPQPWGKYVGVVLWAIVLLALLLSFLTDDDTD